MATVYLPNISASAFFIINALKQKSAHTLFVCNSEEELEIFEAAYKTFAPQNFAYRFVSVYEDKFSLYSALEKFLREASNAVYAKEDFDSLPPLLQAYIEECGYIGSPRKSVLKMEYMKVDFALGQNRPKLKIDYSQVDFANAPVRES